MTELQPKAVIKMCSAIAHELQTVGVAISVEIPVTGVIMYQLRIVVNISQARKTLLQGARKRIHRSTAVLP